MRLSADDLTLTVAGRTLFRGLDFSWEGPSVVAVMGPSGAGKSTLLSSIMGWTRPSGGTFSIDPPDSTIWFVPQNAPLLDSRTVSENIRVAMLASPLTANKTSRSSLPGIGEVMSEFGLQRLSDTRAKHLSGGERQRVALARASVRRPSILLADEVTAGLDPVSVEMVCGSLRALASRGALVVVATHDARVRSLADGCLDLGADS
jgi:ABC-type multidrug transport system ATPase subunit